MRKAGRGLKTAKRIKLSAMKQRAILQQLEPVRGVEKIVIKPSGKLVKRRNSFVSRAIYACHLYCVASFH